MRSSLRFPLAITTRLYVHCRLEREQERERERERETETRSRSSRIKSAGSRDSPAGSRRSLSIRAGFESCRSKRSSFARGSSEKRDREGSLRARVKEISRSAGRNGDRNRRSGSSVGLVFRAFAGIECPVLARTTLNPIKRGLVSTWT